MKLNIKNMYSQHCLVLVKEELSKLELNYVSVELGSAEFVECISPDQVRQLSLALSGVGFELPEYNRLLLVGKIKEVVIEYVQHINEQANINFSDHLSARLQYDYTYLANVFSKDEGITIEKFIIMHKVQRAKLLIKDCGLKLTEISKMLHYSSVAHFSNQFKQVSRLTPSAFKKQVCKERVSVSGK